MDGWTDGQTDLTMDHGRTDRQMDGLTNGKDGWMDIPFHRVAQTYINVTVLVHIDVMLQKGTHPRYIGKIAVLSFYF